MVEELRYRLEAAEDMQKKSLRISKGNAEKNLPRCGSGRVTIPKEFPETLTHL